MALNGLCCADVPLSNYSLTHSGHTVFYDDLFGFLQSPRLVVFGLVVFPVYLRYLRQNSVKLGFILCFMCVIFAQCRVLQLSRFHESLRAYETL